MKQVVSIIIFYLLTIGFANADPIQPGLSAEHVSFQSKGCISCHLQTDAPSMHKNPAVQIGCADCHGGKPDIDATGIDQKSAEYQEKKQTTSNTNRNPAGD